MANIQQIKNDVQIEQWWNSKASSLNLDPERKTEVKQKALEILKDNQLQYGDALWTNNQLIEDLVREIIQ